MTVIEALKNRRAIRNYTTQPVEKEKIEQILQAATFAPNDRMREPWHFYILQGEAMKRYEEMANAYLQERFPTKAKPSGKLHKGCSNNPDRNCCDS